MRSLFLTIAASKRITDILLLEEYGNSHNDNETGICLQHSSWSWTNEPLDTQIVLKDISFVLRPGEMLIVAGPVGCGKTSLLMALLKEISLVSGIAQTEKSVAYVPSDLWVISGSIRDNILMGQAFDPENYDSCIEKSSLINDLASFEFEDETLVGDNGVTLSGGQKARLSFARALYVNKNILLLDDPLSAVDNEVSTVLLESICWLKTQGKCIVLVTHQLNALNYADKVLILDQGRQRFCGSYEELKTKDEILRLIDGKEPVIEKKRETRQSLLTPRKVLARSLTGTSPVLKLEEETKIKGGVPLKVYWKYLLFGFKQTVWIVFFVVFMLLCQVGYLSPLLWSAIWINSPDQRSLDNYLMCLCIIVAMYGVGVAKYS